MGDINLSTKKSATVSIVLHVVIAFNAFVAVSAIAIRGHTPWLVLRCRFSDTTAITPQSDTFFQNFFTESGNGKKGLSDYWRDVSNDAIDLQGSTVKEWINLSVTSDSAKSQDRWGKIQDCVQAAENKGISTKGFYVTVIINAVMDSGSAGGRVLLDPLAWFNSFAAHEMGHSYGLQHSFSDDTSCKNADWSAPGEYCNPWDLMSVQASFMVDAGTYSLSGPGLNAPYLERLGWIPIDRIYTMGYNGETTRTFTLVALSRRLTGAPAGGVMTVRIPYDAGNGFVYYTVELRLREGWDGAIPQAAVLINEVRDDGRSYLVTNPTQEWLPGQTFSRSQSWTTFSVRVNSIDATGGTASVTVISDYAQRCLPGWVWREATANDRVCVTPAVRNQVRLDNAAASSRRIGLFGFCINGFVWREAVAGDRVCVRPSERSQAQTDNTNQATRVNPARYVFGPLTCKQGYVWREADKIDYVCVEPWERDRVRADNAVATSRWVNGAYGPQTCVSGYVWREAFPGDKVCTTPDFRARCALSNSQYDNSRLAKP